MTESSGCMLHPRIHNLPLLWTPAPPPAQSHLVAAATRAGADPEIYFPYFDTSRRLVEKQPAIRELLYGREQGPHLARGALRDPSKPLLFTMARLDRVKNLAGACAKQLAAGPGARTAPSSEQH